MRPVMASPRNRINRSALGKTPIQVESRCNIFGDLKLFELVTFPSLSRNSTTKKVNRARRGPLGARSVI